MRFVEEILRRHVHRMAAAYLVTAWLIIQVAGTIFPLFGFDATPARVLFIVLAIGFVPAVILSWAFRITPEGLRLERRVNDDPAAPGSTRTLDRSIMVVLAIAVAYFAVDKFVFSPAREASIASAARLAGRSEALTESYGDKSIAVLPFDDLSEGRDQEYFSDGISEELLNLLARVPELRVTSRTSAFTYKSHRPRLSQIARELNVAHILEGSRCARPAIAFGSPPSSSRRTRTHTCGRRRGIARWKTVRGAGRDRRGGRCPAQGQVAQRDAIDAAA